MDLQLQNKIAIVTGSSRGLGFASAQALIQEGCRVAICARGDARLREAAADLTNKATTPDQVLAIQADVSTAAGVDTIIRRTVETMPSVNVPLIESRP